MLIYFFVIWLSINQDNKTYNTAPSLPQNGSTTPPSTQSKQSTIFQPEKLVELGSWVLVHENQEQDRLKRLILY